MHVKYNILVFILLCYGHQFYGLSGCLENKTSWSSSFKTSSESDDYMPPAMSSGNQSPTITYSKTDVKCFGDHSGSIIITTSGTTGSVNYLWTDGVSTKDRSGLAAGTYTLNVTDDSGLTSLPVTIVQPATSLTATLTSQVNVMCFGQATGSVVITQAGGTAPYTITPVQTGLPAGIHTFTITDSNGCSTTVNTTITQPVAALSASITSQVNVLCFGQATGSVVITPAGGTAPYTITPAQSGLPAGIHTFTVTDSNGCSTTVNTTITQPVAALSASITSQVNVLCFGQATGSVVITPAGGTAPYTITPAQSGLPAGIHTFTVTDSNGCSTTVNTTITQPVAALSASITSQVNVLCFGQATGSVVITPAGGTAPYTITPVQTGLPAGIHTFTVTDSNGCSTTVSATIIQPASALTLTTTQVNVLCFGQATGTATATPFGGSGPYSYSWNTVPVQTTSTATGLKAGSYIVTVTDASLCSNTATVTITQPPVLTISAISSNTPICQGSTLNLSVTSAGGSPDYNYVWTGPNGFSSTSQNPSIPDALTSASGTYTLTITDANGCSISSNTSVTVKPLPTVTATPSSQSVCSGNPTSIILSGTVAGTTYAWTAALTTGTASGFADGNGNSITQTLINNTAAPATVTYTITPSANGCSGSPITVLITVNPLPVATATPALQTICTAGTTSITLASTTAGTTFNWTASLTSGTATGFANGSGTSIVQTLINNSSSSATVSYTVTPSANGCTGTPITVIVTVNPNATITLTSAPATKAQVLCISSTLTDITYAIGGSGTGVYLSAGGLPAGVTGSFAAGVFKISGTPTVSGTYLYTITTTGPCAQTSTSGTITIYPIPSVSAISDHSFCNGISSTAINISGPVPGTTFSWSNNNTTIGLAASGTGSSIPSFTTTNSTADPISAVITITPSANGCLGPPITFTITVNPAPVLNTPLSGSVCSGTLLNYTPGSLTTGTVFVWSRSAITGISNSANSGTGNISETLINVTSNPINVTYVYTLTANGCSNLQNVIETILPVPTLISTVTPTDICSNTPFNYTPLFSISGTTATWSRAAIAGISNPTSSGSGSINETLINTTTSSIDVVYIYTLNVSGCTNTQNVTVKVKPTPALSSALTSPAICSNSLLSYTPTSETSGVTFIWNRSSVAGITPATGSGLNNPNEVLINTSVNPVNVTYTYSLSAAGCTNTQNVVVTVSPSPILSSSVTKTTICSNTAFSYLPTSGTAGTVFSWSRALVAGISNPGGSGTDNPNEVLVNTTSGPLDVTYIYNLSASGCIHNQNITVRVNPLPTLTSELTPAPICSNTLFSYVPTSGTAGTIFAWSRAAVTGISNPAANGTGNPNEILVNSSVNPVIVTYTYTLAASGCTNPVKYDVAVTVNPQPILTSTISPPAICSNTLFSYTPTSGTVGTAFSWTRAAVGGLSNPASSGTGNPNEILINTSPLPVSVTYIYSLSATGCINSTLYSVVVIVNPNPTLTSSLTPAAICSNTVFSYSPTSGTAGTSFSWSRAALPGISNSSASGTGNPGETLINTTTSPISVSYLYTLSANGCSNPTIFTVSVVVNPLPILTSTQSPPAICSNTQFSYTPTSSTTGVQFNWSRAAIAEISNPASSGTGDPAETLFNTSVLPVSVTYVYTLSSNGCNAITSYSVVVAVNPVPTLSSVLNPPAVCSNSVFSYLPTSGTSGTSFTWSRGSVPGISNLPNSGSDNPNETLINTTTAPVSVSYLYTLSGNGCANPTSSNVVVTVNPNPILTSSLTPPAICTNTPFFYTPTSSTPGTSFAWSRAAVTGISNLSLSGIGNPNETLINTTTDPIDVIYKYTLSANGCVNTTTYDVVVSVRPRPILTSSLTPPAVCSNTVFSYSPTSASAGTQFIWSRALIAGISNAAASGSGDPKEILLNTTNVPINVIYVYQLSANGCTNPTTYPLTVTVNPEPVLTSTLAPTGICSNTVFSYTPTSYTGGATFTWNRAAIAGITNPAASGTGNPSENLVNTTTSPINVVYTYSVSANGCTNSITYNVVVSVNPVPVFTSSLTPPEICSNTMFSYTPTSSIAGTAFGWTRSAVTGISNPSTSGTDNPNETLINTTNAPINVTYVYTLTYGNCQNPIKYNVTVVVNPTPLLSGLLNPPDICSNSTFNYSPASNCSGTTFLWSRNVLPGISNPAASGAGNPNETLINTTASQISVTYAYSLSASMCANTQNVNVVVTPLPILTSSLTPTDICSNTLFSYTPTSNMSNATYSWSRGAIAGISNPAISGTGNISETLINTTGSPLTVTYVFTLSAGGCTNPATFSVALKVIPSPVLTSSTTPPAVCSGSVFSYLPTSSAIGTTFKWERSAVAGISNPAANGTDNPNETLINTTSASINVTYVYSLIIVGCSSPPVYNVTVEVKPAPILSSSLTPTGICSNALFSYNPTSGTAGTTFAWSRAEVTGISNPAATGSNNISEYLDNTTTSPIDVTYVYTLTANGCTNTQNVMVKVTPMPSLTSAINPPNVCSTHSFTYTPTSNVAGITFNWSRAAVAGISNPEASGVGNINESLINTTLSSVLVTYVYTMSLNGCTNSSNVQVLVVPAPPVSASASDVSVCAGSTHNLYSSTTVALQKISLLTETFDGAIPSWTLTNNSSGGTASTRTATAWAAHSDGYLSLHSYKNSQFYISNSSGHSGTTATILQSPAINISGYSILTLDFYQYYNYNNLESATVEVSTNGSTWTAVATYTSTQGSAAVFAHPSIDLSSFTPNSNIYIRFKYDATHDNYWAIDNFTVTGTVAPTVSWSSVPAGFTSNLANPTNITLSQTTTYTATYSYPGFTCTGQASVTVEKMNDNEPPVIINVPPDVTFECGDCVQAFVNADFEGNQTINPWAYVRSVPGNQGVPGWLTTAPSGNMEIQHSGCTSCGSPISYSGNYHAELNSDGVGDFYQQFCTVPTTTVQVIFHHMKRVPPVHTPPYDGPDVMEVYAGPNLSSLALVYTASTTSTTTWTTNIVNVPIPVGQTSTIFLFRAKSTASGNLTYGNLIDGIQAVTLFNSFLLPSATDNCPGVDLSVSEVKTPGTCSSNYTLKRTWTATDASGNKSYAYQTVTVGDFIAPVLHGIPSDITISCETPIPVLPTVTATDNCVTPVVTFLGEVKTEGSCPNNYILTRSWKATDFCNNTSTGSYNITVRDTTSPVITLPPPIHISCGTSTLPTFTGMATVIDNCDPNPVLKWTDSTTPGSCLGNFEINRTWVATDQCGNSTSAVQAIVLQDISVRDNTPPVITLPASFPVNCGSPTLPADIGWATVTDNCDPNPQLTYSDVATPGTCSGRSQIIRTWRAIDACGNITNTPQTIDIIDIIAPVISGPANITINCDASRLPAATGGSATATDNCDPNPVVTYTDVTTAGSCAGANVILRTWKATDSCGNSSTTVQTITTQDIIAPVITCPAPITINCNVSQLPATTGTATATDNCDSNPVITYTDVLVPGSEIGNSLITRTWKATDACGNFTTCMQLITVHDITAPIITCPANLTLNCEELPQTARTDSATATDNCDPAPVITYSDVSTLGSCPGSSIIVRTWTARDASGNVSSCIQTITKQDVTAPVILCPGNKNINCQDSSDPSSTGTATATDNCDLSPAITFTDVNAPGSCTGNHVISRTWMAKDACGNTTTCVQTINVQDITAPVLTCPIDVTIPCSASSLPASTGVATATDGCDTDPVVTYSDVVTPGSCAGNYVIARTWKATDHCGNAGTCVQTITVQDIVPPAIICPANLTINCQSSPLPASTGTAIATDNCGSAPAVTYSDIITAGSCSGNYLINRTWSATDGCGNLSNSVQIITVRDISAPVITCPAPITINIEDSPLPINTGTATATDNCDTAPAITFADIITPGSCPGKYLISRTWTATDACHNTSNCVQIITVQDITPPFITCPANLILNCQDPIMPATTGSATATDNSGLIPVITYTDASVQGSCAGNHIITRTWRATDNCGNFSTCNQILTIQDITPPVITCPAAITINCGTANSPSITGTATATDGCDPAPTITYTDTNASGNCAGNSVITRIWSATDACGNRSSCNQIITIQDIVAPVLTCPANITISCDDSTLPATTGTVIANDNCDSAPVVSYTDIIVPGSCASNYTISRTWKGTDNCNNSSTCVQKITVQDITPPSINCPAPLMVECLSDIPVPDISSINVTDNCAGPVTITFVGDVSDNKACPNMITRTYKATDACGNSSSCSQFIIVEDHTAPVLVGVPSNITVGCSAVPVAATPTATDNCDLAPVITYNEVTTPGTCPGSYTVTRKWTATDKCNNATTGTQVITVQDITPPVITCPVSGNQTVDTNTGNVYLHSNDSWNASATDACSSFTITATLSGATTGSALLTLNGVSFNSGATTITWSAIDACGNRSSCSFTVTVNAGADLSITLAALPSPVILGQNITYTIWVKNLGPSTAANVTVSEVLPTGLTLVNFSSNVGTWDGIATWSIGSLNYNEVATLTITAKANPTHCSDFSNQVSVASPTTDPIVTNNSAILVTPVIDSTDPEITTCPVTRLIPGCSTNEVTGPAFSNVATTSSYAEFSNGTNKGVATDNCGITSVTYQDAANGTNPIVVIRTWTLKDAVGNETTCKQRIEVADTTPPTFNAPGPFSFCVENVWSAAMLSNTLKINPDPDYYLFIKGNTSLDLDPVINNFKDNCCAVNTLEIHWRIDFADTPNQTPPPSTLTHPPITGTGQPSLYAADIQIPGDGVTYLNVVHTITYWLIDCNGNKSVDKTVNITIKPRPEVK